MSILWLIVKLILYVLLGIIVLIIGAVSILLLSPIRYRVYFEKYEQVAYDIHFRFLGGIKGHFEQEDGVRTEEIRAFWKILYKSKIKEGVEVEQVDRQSSDKVDLEVAPIKKIQSSHMTKQIDSKKKSDAKKSQVIKQDENDNEIIKKRVKQVAETSKIAQTVKEQTKQEAKKVEKDFSYADLSALLFDKMTYCFIKDSAILIWQYLKKIAPRKWDFEIVVGKEDAAETGVFIAQLTMLYPLYYKHGVIKGDYERECLEGGCYLEGKFRIGQLIMPTLKWLLKPSVKNIIKKIMEK